MSSQLINMISASFVETIIMILISGGIGAAIGIPLGILLFITDRKSFLPMPKFHFVLSIISTLPDRYRPHFARSDYSVHSFGGRLFNRYCGCHRSTHDLCGSFHCPHC